MGTDHTTSGKVETSHNYLGLYDGVQPTKTNTDQALDTVSHGRRDQEFHIFASPGWRWIHKARDRNHTQSNELSKPRIVDIIFRMSDVEFGVANTTSFLATKSAMGSHLPGSTSHRVEESIAPRPEVKLCVIAAQHD